MSVYSTEAEKVIIDWCKKNNEENKKQAVEIELSNLWMEAREIISEFNEYGGGSCSDGEEAADNLWRMDELVKKLVLETKWNINIIAIAKQLYNYSKETGDYDSEKKMLLLILDTCDKSEIKEWFETCKKELRNEDWEKEYDNILQKIRKKDEKFYLDICMKTGKEAIVLETLQNVRHGYDPWDLDYDGYFSKRLFKKYPNEVLALYWRDVNLLLSVANNKNYDEAVKLLRRIKPLMKKSRNAEEWNKQFDELKERHRRKRNFMALLGDL